MRGLLVMTHGITGNANESYVRAIANQCKFDSFGVVAVNCRGTGGSVLMSSTSEEGGDRVSNAWWINWRGCGERIVSPPVDFGLSCFINFPITPPPPRSLLCNLHQRCANGVEYPPFSLPPHPYLCCRPLHGLSPGWGGGILVYF